jgi:Flp pilus assembly protein protease CpaA
MDSEEVITWTRLLVLVTALGIAAWLDHKERRVPNEFWITWSKPAIFLWVLDLLIVEAEWYVFATAAGMVAYASTTVIGRPTVKDILSGNRMDVIVSIWYLIGIAGVIQGLLLHSNEGILPVLVGDASTSATIWWSVLAVSIPLILVDLAWRMRLIHGGADCKGLMWIAILVPSWSSIPIIFPTALDSAVVAMPPAVALLVWGGFAFLILPVMMVIKNLKNGQTNPRLIWHAERMDIDKVIDSHVWLLTTIADMPSGDKKIIHRTRAPRRTPSKKQLADDIAVLKENGIDTVWITRKYPLLVFLWPAVIPLVLIGGPMAYIMPILGL